MDVHGGLSVLSFFPCTFSPFSLPFPFSFPCALDCGLRIVYVIGICQFQTGLSLRDLEMSSWREENLQKQPSKVSLGIQNPTTNPATTTNTSSSTTNSSKSNGNSNSGNVKDIQSTKLREEDEEKIELHIMFAYKLSMCTIQIHSCSFCNGFLFFLIFWFYNIFTYLYRSLRKRYMEKLQELEKP